MTGHGEHGENDTDAAPLPAPGTPNAAAWLLPGLALPLTAPALAGYAGLRAATAVTGGGRPICSRRPCRRRRCCRSPCAAGRPTSARRPWSATCWAAPG